jgi:glutamate/tyrosine decarboxylase-like PLP-dependent enzyme
MHAYRLHAYRSVLERAARLALDYLESLDQRQVGVRAQQLVMLERLGSTLADEGISAERVIDELVRDAEPGIMGSAGGRFFAWVVGGALPSALAADWLTVAWDQNAVLVASAPAAAMVEEVAGEWLKQILGLPTEASFAFVSGCQMAHITCLAAARHAFARRTRMERRRIRHGRRAAHSDILKRSAPWIA